MLYVMMCDVREQTFGERVKDRREELEWSQEYAAKLARVGVDTWRSIERGYKARGGVDPTTSTYRPVRITVRKIAKALGWPPEKALLWAGYDEPKTDPVVPVLQDQFLVRVEAAWPKLQIERRKLIVLLIESLADQNTRPSDLVSPDPAARYTHKVIDTPREDTPPSIPARRDDNDR